MGNLVGPVALKGSFNIKSKVPSSSVVIIIYEQIRKELKLSNAASSSW